MQMESASAIDSDLVARARDGDEQAFTLIVVRYQQSLGSYLFRLLGDEEVARDLIQETFLDAFRKLSSLRNPDQLRTWLYRIAINKSRGWRRRERLIQWLPLASSINRQQADDLETGESRDAIRDTLAKLRTDQAIALLLHDLAGFKSEEVAEILSISTAAARKRITRGKQAFRFHYLNLPGTAPVEEARKL